MQSVTMAQDSPNDSPVAATAAAGAAAAKPKKLLEKKKNLPERISYPFWFGGSASSLAACVTHPLDLGTCDLPPLGPTDLLPRPADRSLMHAAV